MHFIKVNLSTILLKPENSQLLDLCNPEQNHKLTTALLAYDVHSFRLMNLSVVISECETDNFDLSNRCILGEEGHKVKEKKVLV